MTDTNIGLIVVLVAAVCQAIKKTGWVDKRFIPFLSIVLGLAGTFFFGGVSFLTTAVGVIVGLSTVGGYEVVSTSILNK